MSWPADARPGEPVLSRFTKWPGLEHWRRDGVWLGTDDHGAWIGRPVGSRNRRPGADYPSPLAGVTLVPDTATDWIASFSVPTSRFDTSVYVDLMWDVAWSPEERGVLTGIDMDLDVIRNTRRGTFLDDEDEFAEHSARWGYPEEVHAQVAARAESLLVDVRAGTPPFDEATGAGWLDRLSRLA